MRLFSQYQEICAWSERVHDVFRGNSRVEYWSSFSNPVNWLILGPCRLGSKTSICSHNLPLLVLKPDYPEITRSLQSVMKISSDIVLPIHVFEDRNIDSNDTSVLRNDEKCKYIVMIFLKSKLTMTRGIRGWRSSFSNDVNSLRPSDAYMRQ